MGDFGGESVVRRGRIKGVVLTLDWVTEKNDELDGEIGSKSKIEIPTRQLVNLIYDQNGGRLQKASFPSRNAPRVLWGQAKVRFPFSAKFGGGYDDSELTPIFGTEEMLDGTRFATASKTG